MLRPARPQRGRQDHHHRDPRRPARRRPPARSRCSAGAGARDDDDIRQRIGISLQETRLSEKLTVRETLTLFRSFYRQRARARTRPSRRVSLEEKADARVGKLSGGQKQRLAVACALVGDPELLFLDEPTTGLDPQSRRQLWDIIRDFRGRGRTVLLTTHYMDEAERLCDRVAIVDHGKVIALGTPRELIARAGRRARHRVQPRRGRRPARTRPALADLPARAVGAARGRPAISLAVTEPHVALPALLDRLQAGGRELASLTTRHASLEDVFVTLTGRHLRDEEEPTRMNEHRTAARRRYSPLGQLVLARLREFYREPEAVFWVYGFPILMAVALGIAFRNQPVEQYRAWTWTTGPAAAGGRRRPWASRRRGSRSRSTTRRPRAGCGCGPARPTWWSSPRSSRPAYEYLFDPTRPESLLARDAVDDALQRAAGRQRPGGGARRRRCDEPGGRYIDFLVPGLLGMSLMGGGLWGVGFVIVDMRIRKLLKRFLATPMRKRRLPGGASCSAGCCSWCRRCWSCWCSPGWRSACVIRGQPAGGAWS